MEAPQLNPSLELDQVTYQRSNNTKIQQITSQRDEANALVTKLTKEKQLLEKDLTAAQGIVKWLISSSYP